MGTEGRKTKGFVEVSGRGESVGLSDEERADCPINGQIEGVNNDRILSKANVSMGLMRFWEGAAWTLL